METPFERRRVIVTGAAGFIGSHVVQALSERGEDVIGVDIRPRTRNANVHHRVADLRDAFAALRALKDADVIIHLASDMGGVGYFHTNDFSAPLNNLAIDRNVLTIAERYGIEKVFYASSACTYPIEFQQSEGHALRFREFERNKGTADQMYGHEKRIIAQLMERAPFDGRVGIFHTIYGPGQEWTGPRAKFPPSVAGRILEAQRNNTDAVFWGNGQQLRSYLYIDDAVDKILTVLDADEYAGPVNIGYEGAVTCEQIALLCANIVGLHPAHVKFDTEAGPTGVVSRDCDNQHYNQQYGKKHLMDYEEGFARLIHWIAKQS